MRDLKFVPDKFKSQTIVKELSNVDDHIEFLANSSWMIISKNNEYEIFRLSKLGDIKWILRSKKRKFS